MYLHGKTAVVEPNESMCHTSLSCNEGHSSLDASYEQMESEEDLMNVNVDDKIVTTSVSLQMKSMQHSQISYNENLDANKQECLKGYMVQSSILSSFFC